MHEVQFAPEAAEEFLEAQAWYGGEAAFLARRFRDAVDRIVERISDNPLQFPRVHRNVRRAVLTRFPYSVYFVVDGRVVRVVSVFHGSRHPRRWNGGLSN